MLLDGALASANHDEDVGDPTRDRLLNDVLDHRLVEDRQHFLRDRLADRQEARAVAGGRDHSFADARAHADAEDFFRVTICGLHTTTPSGLRISVSSSKFRSPLYVPTIAPPLPVNFAEHPTARAASTMRTWPGAIL